jgi:hypothetical protein
VKQVGRELGVSYVLEGSVRKAGERVRFTAQRTSSTCRTKSPQAWWVRSWSVPRPLIWKIADLIVDGKGPLPLEPFRADRFNDGSVAAQPGTAS